MEWVDTGHLPRFHIPARYLQYVFCMHRAGSPQSPLGIPLGPPPPSLTSSSLSECNRADRYWPCRRENSCRGRAMVATLLRVSLSSGLHCAAAFVLGTQVTQGTCPPEQSMLHLPLAAAHQPKVSQKSWQHRTCGSLDRSGKVPSAATPASWTGMVTWSVIFLGYQRTGAGGRGIAWS